MKNDTKRGAAFWLRVMEMRKHELTHDYRKTLRNKAREGISEDDLRITDETLEKMAKNLGWDESQREPHRGPGFGRRGFRRHGMMHGFGHQPHSHPEHSPTEPPQA